MYKDLSSNFEQLCDIAMIFPSTLYKYGFSKHLPYDKYQRKQEERW